jgi:hypothetical protein
LKSFERSSGKPAEPHRPLFIAPRASSGGRTIAFCVSAYSSSALIVGATLPLAEARFVDAPSLDAPLLDVLSPLAAGVLVGSSLMPPPPR